MTRTRLMRKVAWWGYGSNGTGILPTALPPEMLAFTAGGVPYNRRAQPRLMFSQTGAPIAIGNVAMATQSQDLLANPFGKQSFGHRPLGRNVLYGIPPGTLNPRGAGPYTYDAGKLGERGRLAVVGTFRVSGSATNWKYIVPLTTGDTNRRVDFQGSSYGGGTGDGLPTTDRIPPEASLPPSTSGDNEVLVYPTNGSGTTARSYAQFKWDAENPALSEASARAAWEYALDGHDVRDTWVDVDNWGPYASEIRLHSCLLRDADVDLTGATPILHRLYTTATRHSGQGATADQHILSRTMSWGAWNTDGGFINRNGYDDNSGDIPYGTVGAIRWQDAGLRETIGLSAFGKRLFDCFMHYGCIIGDGQGQIVDGQPLLQLRADSVLGANATKRDEVSAELQKILPHMWPVFNPRLHDAGDASERHADGLYYLCGGGPLDDSSVNSAWDAA